MSTKPRIRKHRATGLWKVTHGPKTVRVHVTWEQCLDAVLPVSTDDLLDTVDEWHMVFDQMNNLNPSPANLVQVIEAVHWCVKTHRKLQEQGSTCALPGQISLEFYELFDLYRRGVRMVGVSDTEIESAWREQSAHHRRRRN